MLVGLLLLALLLPLAPRSAAAQVVAEEALERARAEGDARVFVLLRDPGTESGAKRTSRIAELRRGVLRSVSPHRLEVVHELSALSAFSARGSAAALAALSAHPDVLRIDLDEEGGGSLEVSVPQIRADRVHVRGILGQGAVVAVLDTGVDRDHPDLAQALVHEECFCAGNCCPDGSSRQSGTGSAASRHAHGVHVSGIAVSQGNIAAPGVAPGAALVAVRVLNDQNRGFLSDWIAGLDWVASSAPDVRIVNMSLVSDSLFAGDCDQASALTMAFADLIELLAARGTLVFAAAGNNGFANRMTAPACVRLALSVGAVDSEDQIALFGNSGPNLDLVAPGVNIVSDAPGGALTVMSGTSMATPHAAGVGALLVSAQPGATFSQLQTALRESGVPVRDPRNGLDFPRVSALAALNAITSQADLLLGGGSAATDCLIEWNFLPPAIARPQPRPTATCQDGSRSCDADAVPGQCTFQLSVCFNFPDPRLPECSVSEPVLFLTPGWTPARSCVGDCDASGEVSIDEMVRAVAIALGAEPLATCPTADREDDFVVATDDLITIVGNATAGCTVSKDLNSLSFRDFLPPPPIGRSTCSPFFPFVVRRDGDQAGFGAIRLLAETGLRRDYDRVVLVCNP